ncbi:MAG: TPM domain-containing protein, partial [Nitrospiraceae bacterium]|nr:TPM domain-containing protein [Nitrospiraceae bacterium]
MAPQATIGRQSIMVRKGRRAFALLFFILSALLVLAPAKKGFADTKFNLPAVPANYVVDLAGIINPAARQRLDGYLQELETKTTAQVIVLTVPDLNGQPIDDFSLSVAEKWKLGQKGKDNGALLLVALKERQYRFEIGYGLEGTLPDSYVGTLGREYLVPNFKRGDYSDGIELAVSAIVQKIAGDAKVRISGLANAPAPLQTADAGGFGTFNLILTGLFFLIAMGLFIRHPGLFLLLLMSGGFGGGGGFG